MGAGCCGPALAQTAEPSASADESQSSRGCPCQRSEARPADDAPQTGGDTLYDRVGGRTWFEELVSRFYDGVARDPVLRPLYPKDLTAPREHLTAFLVQYWGGPGDYSAERGHPRLRMRHARFPIGGAERNAWYQLMADSVLEGNLRPDDEADILQYFANTTRFLANQP